MGINPLSSSEVIKAFLMSLGPRRGVIAPWLVSNLAGISDPVYLEDMDPFSTIRRILYDLSEVGLNLKWSV